MAAARIELVPETPEERDARQARFDARKEGLVLRASANAAVAIEKALAVEAREASKRSNAEAAAWHLEQDGRVVAYGDAVEAEGGTTLLSGVVAVGPIAKGSILTLRVGR